MTGILLAALVVLAAVGWRVSGGDWFVVQSPSMGTTAPVGTLVVTTPIGDSPLHVGEIITFHPPPAPHSTYTHRIVRIDGAGRVSTRGDINGAADGWTLTRSDVIGRAAAVLPGVGWLVRMLPFLLIGGITVWAASSVLRTRDRRVAVRFVGLALVVTGVLALMRPLTAVTALATVPTSGGTRSLIAATGLLPVRVSAGGGPSVALSSGQVGWVVATGPAGSRYAFDVALDLPWFGWVVLLLVCAAPTVAAVVFARRREAA